MNWNDITVVTGHFSLNDRFFDLLKKPKGMLWTLGFVMKSLLRKKSGKKGDSGLINLHKNMIILNYIGLFRKLGVSYSNEELIKLNEELNRIKS